MNTYTKHQEKYILRAMEVFKTYGFKLSLDDLAQKMGISKKTLYNQFSSKDELLALCVYSLRKDFEENLSVMYDPEVNAIEGMRRGFQVLITFFIHLSPSFFTDLQRTYPEVANNQHVLGLEIFNRAIIKNIEKGIQEKNYRNALDVKLIAHYFSFSIISFFINSIVNKHEFPVTNYFDTIVDYNLHALVTDKGKLLLK